MLAANRVLFGPWHLGPGGQFKRPNPTVKNRLSSMMIGTLAFMLLSWLVNAVTVFVSLNLGTVGINGFANCPVLEGEAADSYSKIAVAVVLSNAAFCAVAYGLVAM